MMTPTDIELLERYLRDGSEEAFTTLVHRHLDLVYTAAMRQVRSPQLAEEVAQSVFLDLSRNAGRLKPETMLTGWLYQVTRRTAIDVVRRETRRQAREQLAAELTDMNTQPANWNHIEPLLDEAMADLETAERNAVLLRFFEGRSLREVGQSLGLSEDAAQKRVSRAVERLRGFFSRQGMTVSTGALIAALSANAVQSAPMGLAASISAGTLSSATVLAAATTTATTKFLAMTTIQKALIAGTLTVAVGAGIYQGHLVSQLKQQVQTLNQEQEPLRQNLQQAQRDREEAMARLETVQEEAARLRLGVTELPKLRGEVSRLRESARELDNLKVSAANRSMLSNDPAMESAFKTWAARASRLRQKLNQATDQHIPELSLLTEKHWFDAVKNMKQLETDEDYQRAFSEARNIAKSEFGNVLRHALRGYLDANDGQLPGDLSQLKPFFDKPVEDAALQRYKLLQSGKLSDASGEYLVAETAPLIDEEHDAVYQFSLNGTNARSGSPYDDMVKEAGIKYAEANNGMLPTDPAQLAQYLQQPLDPEKINRVLRKIPPGVTTLQQLRAVMK